MLLNAAIEAAIDLNDPYEGNREYARGQTELICDMFGLQEAKYEIFRKITNGADLEAIMSCICCEMPLSEQDVADGEDYCKGCRSLDCDLPPP